MDSNDCWNKDKITEYLDENPSVFQEYLECNPQLLDKYVTSQVDEQTIAKWLEKIDQRATEALLPLRVDYLVEKNGKAQHTDKYVNKNLVIRRAEKFDFDIFFKNRSFNQNQDKLVVEFSIGENPTLGNKTLFRVPTGESLQENKWTSKITDVDHEKKMISVQVNIPSDAIIGRYKLVVEVSTMAKDELIVKRKPSPDVIVLFNPFSEADEVYMAEEDKRNEYVLNDIGIIYYGQWAKIGGRRWLFGQFEPGILDIALKLLREAPNVKKNPVKCTKKRSSPVYCSRTLSAMINQEDDNGVLLGNWSGEYDGGKRPTFWNGSVKILKQWRRKNMKEVRYGQCWVFSGVLTTVLRAIGIPARSVTNFLSAHDTDSSMTIDRYINDNGEIILTKGSIWNFHVWNEGWFRRPDLPKGYDGWQALDATPQEESDGVYQCGPAPVKAVKNGEIYLGHDTNFLFGEVNADRLTWSMPAFGETSKLYKREKHLVGRNISTKAVGSNAREDITHDYKFPEGSKEERAAFDRAYALGKKVFYHENLNVIKDEGDITIDISNVEDAINGKAIAISVKVCNNTMETRTGIVTTTITSMLNNGQRKTLIKKEKIEAKLEAEKETTRILRLSFADYGRHLADNNAMQVFTTVRINETNNFYVDTYDVEVKSPDCLEINCPEEVLAGRNVDVSFTFVNPLPVTLTAGVFSIEGNGVVADDVTLSEPVPPNATIRTKPTTIRVNGSGEKTLIADFDSNEILNIKGEKRIKILTQ